MKKICIIGAGPAGITFADKLLQLGGDFKIDIYEKSSYIGGISKTVEYKGNRIDIGGHRFFSKSDEVMKWWANKFPLALGNDEYSNGINITYHNQKKSIQGFRLAEKSDIDSGKIMLLRKRKSRILYERKLYDYPLKLNYKTISNIGIFRMISVIKSYLYSKFNKAKPDNLEEFIISKFGQKLYSMFFESYTEKVWGKKPKDISAEWGAQRIKGLSIRKIVLDIFTKTLSGFSKKSNNEISQKKTETSLIEKFLYPKFGPGQMWECVAEELTSKGVKILFNHEINSLKFDTKKKNLKSVEYRKTNGDFVEKEYDFVISTMPINELINGIKDEKNLSPFSKNVYNDALKLPYRDFITVGILLNKLSGPNSEILDDNWIYIQEKDVKVGRIQIFNNWSPYLCSDTDKFWIGLEYFCNENDEFWNKKDNEIISMAKNELEKLKLAKNENILDAVILREKKTYPAYFGTYKNFNLIKKEINLVGNLFCIGRNGMHKYNNQDHSMLTALRAAELVHNNNLDISAKEKLWLINTEEEYHEQK